MDNTRPTIRNSWRLPRILALVAITIAAGALLAAGFVLYSETRWVKPEHLSPAAAFSGGTIGTEVMPLSVLRVLPELSRERGHFKPILGSTADWIDQFGFLRSKENKDLPDGFTLSNYRPRSGAPSPIPFVGIGCAACHTSDIVRADGSVYRVVGTGNSSINL